MEGALNLWGDLFVIQHLLLRNFQEQWLDVFFYTLQILEESINSVFVSGPSEFYLRLRFRLLRDFLDFLRLPPFTVTLCLDALAIGEGGSLTL